mgnify:CR=1 FL=1
MAITEADIMREIMLAVSRIGGRVFRNNCGMATTESGNAIRFGVANPGGSDLIGWTATGQFLAIEVKCPGKNPTVEQRNFLDAVTKAGGIAGVARSVDDAVEIIRGGNSNWCDK